MSSEMENKMGDKAETKTYKTNYDPKIVMKIMEDYKKDACLGNTEMFQYLKKYISSKLFGPEYQSYSMQPKYYEEFMQSIALSICEGMRLYEIDRNIAPTTYFDVYIKEGIRKVLDYENGQSSYYGNICRQIRQLTEQRAKKGLETTETDCVLNLPKISATTIKQCYQQMHAIDSIYYYDGWNETEGVSSKFELPYNVTPENAFLDNIDNAIIHEALDKVLTKSEKDVVVLLYGLYNSDLSLLEKILKERTVYTATELYKANGQTGTQVLASLGFTKEQILRFCGLSKEDAELFCQMLNGQIDSPETREKVMEIQTFLQEPERKEKLEALLTQENILRFLKEDGYSDQEIADFINQNMLRVLGQKTIKDYSIEDLLRAKGFTEKDIDNLFSGKKMSQTAISIILSCTTKDIKAQQAKATMKLERVLKRHFPERANTKGNPYAKLMNDTEIAFTSDAQHYADSFMNDFVEEL